MSLAKGYVYNGMLRLGPQKKKKNGTYILHPWIMQVQLLMSSSHTGWFHTILLRNGSFLSLSNIPFSILCIVFKHHGKKSFDWPKKTGSYAWTKKEKKQVQCVHRFNTLWRCFLCLLFYVLTYWERSLAMHLKLITRNHGFTKPKV